MQTIRPGILQVECPPRKGESASDIYALWYSSYQTLRPAGKFLVGGVGGFG